MRSHMSQKACFFAVVACGLGESSPKSPPALYHNHKKAVNPITPLHGNSMLIQWKSAPEDEVVGIDSFGNGELLIGTRQGKLVSTRHDVAEVHIKSDARLTSLLSISQKLTLIFYEKGHERTSASVYESPDIQSVAGLTLHDVNGGALYHHSNSLNKTTIAIIFTSAAIRLIKFDIHAMPKAKVLKTIEMKGVIAGCMSPLIRSMVVATNTEYQLIDLSNGNKIPLFPILQSLKPSMVSFGKEFLVVQGTGSGDPAMGSFVDDRGEVARSGMVIEWSSYPIDLVISGKTIFALCDSDVIAHTIPDETDNDFDIEKRTSHLSGKPKHVFRSSYGISFCHEELLSRLGDKDISTVHTDVAFSLTDNSIELFEPIPKLSESESAIKDRNLEQVPRDAFQENDMGKQRFRYISAYLLLHLLQDSKKTSEAINVWRNANDCLSIDTVFYIFGHRGAPPQNVYPGLMNQIECLHNKRKQLDLRFLQTFLRNEIKRLRRSSNVDIDTLKAAEVLYAKLLYSPDSVDDGLTRFLLEKGLKSRMEILDWSEEKHAYSQSWHYYSFTDNVNDLCRSNMSILRQPDSSQSNIEKASQQSADFVMLPSGAVAKSDRTLDDWSIAMALSNNPKIDSELCLRILMSSKFEQNYDPATILELLKEKTDSGHQWRSYLKHLVSSKGLFKDDLVTLLITDLIDFFESEKSALESMKASFQAFAKESWPKPSYKKWVSSPRSEKAHYPVQLLSIQSELWELMERNLDWVSSRATFDARLSDMKLERSVIYGRLGLIEQSLQSSNEITDYQSILDFSQQFQDLEMRSDVARLSLKVILQISTASKNQVLRDFLKCDAASDLDLQFVSDTSPDSRPFYAVADFVKNRIRVQVNKEIRIQHLYALSKANLK